MKIAIYHNLKRGGALSYLLEISKYLSKKNKLDLYTFSDEKVSPKIFSKIYSLSLKKTNNLLEHMIQILFELRIKNKNLAKIINNENYDVILIFPCLLTQSPYILRYIRDNNKCIYFFNETKREFYEKVSFDHFSARRIIARIIRLPIKYIDKYNCIHSKHIITNSKFTSNNLLKIYNKKSKVIYPALKSIVPKKIKIKNNKKVLSVGLLSMIKGHDFSIEQISGNCQNLTIIGRKCEESKKIFELAEKKNIKLNLIETEDNIKKNNLYKKYSIYLANQHNEPFGITTLEAASMGCYVLGKNEGGTKEIIKNGVNGELYDNLRDARKIIKKNLNKRYITFHQICTIDWKYTTRRILNYYNDYVKKT